MAMSHRIARAASLSILIVLTIVAVRPTGAAELDLPLDNAVGDIENDPLSGKNAERLMIGANNEFAIDLYRKLGAEQARANLFYSPYSLYSALAMTAEEARYDTLEEMARALKFPDDLRTIRTATPWLLGSVSAGLGRLNERINNNTDDTVAQSKRDELAALRKELAAANDSVAKLQQQRKWEESNKAAEAAAAIAGKINALAAQIDQYELKVANALWGEKTYAFEPAYVKTITEHYNADGIHSVDFKNDFPAARETINTWVADHTEQRIKDIVPQMPPDQARLVRLILTNAIYFKGEWAEPFDAKRTKDSPFTLADGSKATAPLMHAPSLDVARYAAFNADGSPFDTPQRLRLGDKPAAGKHYPTPDGFAIVELPYKGGDLSMVVIAPNSPGGLASIEKRLTPEALDGWLSKLAKRNTHVYLPRFKLETEYKLADTLKSMGMKRAFTDPRLPGGADFSGMSASDDPADRLYITKVIHKAFVEVNEVGTEAAAATAVIMARPTAAPIDVPFVPEFRADRPFIYLIRDQRTGAILFIGRMMQPAAE